MRYPKDHVSIFDGVEYRRARRKSRIERGICTKCDNSAESGKTECQSCLDEMRKRAIRSREERKNRGECIQCGKEAVTAGRCQKCRSRNLSLSQEIHGARKLQVMSRYGRHGRAQCCWEGCTVEDLDMLTLDHVENNGAEHRRSYTKTGRGGGTQLYRLLEKQGYPPGYQTLCANHNLKKHILEIRKVKR